MIVEKVLEAKTRRIKQFPVNSNRASDLGHECLRYLVLNRTRWQEKSLHDVRLQMIFDLGNVFEKVVMDDLREAGFTILEQQRPFQWKEYQITGSIDGKLLIEGVAIPMEIKSASPFAFKSINTAEDIKRHKYHYMRKYLSQLTLYMLMNNSERGVFLFKNKTTGEIKEIWLDLDYELGESLLKKAEAINNHLTEGTLPEPMDYDDNICPECPFAHICMPDRIGKEVDIVNDDHLHELLNRRAEIQPFSTEFNAIEKELKTILEGKEKLLVGDWFITGKMVHRNGYAVPDSDYWQKKIMKVDATEGGKQSWHDTIRAESLRETRS